METHNFDTLPQNRPWVIKAGFDPTSPDLHLGHAVLLRRLRKWQDEGHTVVMIVGDFTASIGDPTGKSATRPTLSQEEIAKNAQTYMSQAFLVLDKDKTIIRHNSEWLGEMSASSLLKLMQQFTLSQLLARNDFAKRMADQKPLGLHELIYPVLQGLDSVHVKADLELGGNDQLFNLMMGRRLQDLNNQRPQAVATLPLLLGLDGTQKMSKSLNNHIALLDPPFEMFSKVMSIPDDLIENFAQCLDFPQDLTNPFEAKKNLACDIVSLLSTKEMAQKAQKEWEERFSSRVVPTNLKEFVPPPSQTLPQVLVQCGFAPSMTVARQKIKEGAVRLDGVQVFDHSLVIESEAVLSLGRRHMVKVTPSNQGIAQPKPKGRV